MQLLGKLTVENETRLVGGVDSEEHLAGKVLLTLVVFGHFCSVECGIFASGCDRY